MSHIHTTTPNSGDNYEKSDAHVGPILKFLIAMFLGTGVVLVAMWAMLEGMKKMPLPNSDIELHSLAAERQVPSDPRLEEQRGVRKQVDGNMVDENGPQYFNTKMWSAWRRQWNTQLSTYSWLDEAAGIASVPIERAMQIKLAKGFPTTIKPKN